MGCAGGLPDRALVQELRILAVKAEPPEAPPGTVVTMSALIADPTGAGRALRRTWAICTPNDSGVGSCGDPTRVTLLGTGETASWTIPQSALAGLSFDEAVQGRDVYLVLAVQPEDAAGADAPHDEAFKRIRVSTNPSPNHNPRIASLAVDGGAAAVPAGTSLPVVVTASNGAAESWSEPNGTSGVEDVRFTWSISAGSVADDVSYAIPATAPVDNRWKLPSSSAGGDATLWVVLRDGRGGTDWALQPVTVH